MTRSSVSLISFSSLSVSSSSAEGGWVIPNSLSRSVLYVCPDGKEPVDQVVPVNGADPSPELNEAELLRYLAKAVWYPTALLPGEGVTWEPIDDSTARATIEHGDVSASLEFSFDEDDEVTRVYAEERHRRVDDGFEPTPWSGYWYDYQTRNGMRVPMAGEVVWHLPDGDLNAWRGRVTGISYNGGNWAASSSRPAGIGFNSF